MYPFTKYASPNSGNNGTDGSGFFRAMSMSKTVWVQPIKLFRLSRSAAGGNRTRPSKWLKATCSPLSFSGVEVGAARIELAINRLRVCCLTVGLHTRSRHLFHGASRRRLFSFQPVGVEGLEPSRSRRAPGLQPGGPANCPTHP